MAVLKWMLKLALLPLLLLLILVQWAGIFLTTFSTILTNLLVFVLPYIAIAAIAKISFFADELRDFLQS